MGKLRDFLLAPKTQEAQPLPAPVSLTPPAEGQSGRYRADPGGRFTSDIHRRVQAHVPNPIDQEPLSTAELVKRVIADQHTALADQSEIEKVLEELQDAGYSESLRDGWQNTKLGFDLLTAPPPWAETEEKTDD